MVLEQLKHVVLGLYTLSSVLAFMAYALDKHAAQNNLCRIKEMHLHLLALIGGWPGAWVAQKTLRHKTKKASFQTAFWVTVVLNCAAVGWILAQ